VRIYSLTVKNRLSAIALAVGVVGIGALIVFVGFALFAALAIAGGVLGSGFAAYRWLRGSRPGLPHGDHRLDPTLEVQPRRQPIAPPPEDPRDQDDGSPPSP